MGPDRLGPLILTQTLVAEWRHSGGNETKQWVGKNESWAWPPGVLTLKERISSIKILPSDSQGSRPRLTGQRASCLLRAIGQKYRENEKGKSYAVHPPYGGRSTNEVFVRIR